MSTSPDVLTNRYATVTVTTETVELSDGFVIPIRFRIASTSGYLASLPACGIRHGTEDGRKRCPRPEGHRVDGSARVRDKHNREHCHGWHIESARRFAKEVLATYGARKPKPKAPPKVTYRENWFVPLATASAEVTA